jgi:DNA-directed RNA polymerase specialized sigma subunit
MSQNPIQKKKREERNKRMFELYPHLTYEEIGNVYGITRQRVEQIIRREKKSINLLNI